MKAKLLSVYDEGSIPDTSLIGARGFSVLVDVDGERTLFDTGRRSAYLTHNLDYLEVDVNTVDRVVISHMHIDHIGGLEKFLEMRDEAVDVIIPPDGERMTDVKFLGIPIKKVGLSNISKEARSKMTPSAVGEWTQLSKSLFLSGTPGSGGIDENILVLMTTGGPVMICGCCHCGIGPAIGFVEERTSKKVSGVVGGVHLVDKKKAEVHGIAEALKEKGVPALYLNHCSGQTQRTHLREKLGLKAVKDFYVGTEIQFDV
jgi:7,8-dihydropterin-6-yl-methyl-4-(beta-D-ribofuranosyl)aminobenzene 5'-phosphate synthase